VRCFVPLLACLVAACGAEVEPNFVYGGDDDPSPDGGKRRGKIDDDTGSGDIDTESDSQVDTGKGWDTDTHQIDTGSDEPDSDTQIDYQDSETASGPDTATDQDTEMFDTDTGSDIDTGPPVDDGCEPPIEDGLNLSCSDVCHPQWPVAQYGADALCSTLTDFKCSYNTMYLADNMKMNLLLPSTDSDQSQNCDCHDGGIIKQRWQSTLSPGHCYKVETSGSRKATTIGDSCSEDIEDLPNCTIIKAWGNTVLTILAGESEPYGWVKISPADLDGEACPLSC